MTRHFRFDEAHLPPDARRGGETEVQVTLEIVRGRARRKVRVIQGPVYLIGSATDCDLVLGNSQFPDVHAYLRLEGDLLTLCHLGFAPRVQVNGEPVHRMRLADGDRITTGPYEFLIHVGSSDPKHRKDSAAPEPAVATERENLGPEDQVRDLLAEIQQTYGDDLGTAVLGTLPAKLPHSLKVTKQKQAG